MPLNIPPPKRIIQLYDRTRRMDIQWHLSVWRKPPASAKALWLTYVIRFFRTTWGITRGATWGTTWGTYIIYIILLYIFKTKTKPQPGRKPLGSPEMKKKRLLITHSRARARGPTFPLSKKTQENLCAVTDWKYPPPQPPSQTTPSRARGRRSSSASPAAPQQPSPRPTARASRPNEPGPGLRFSTFFRKTSTFLGFARN